MTPETKIKREIKSYLDSIGAWHFPVTNSGYGVRGIPDIVGCWNGICFAFEVKAPGGTAGVFQILQIEKALAAGACAGIVFSAADVAKALNSVVR